MCRLSTRPLGLRDWLPLTTNPLGSCRPDWVVSGQSKCRVRLNQRRKNIMRGPFFFYYEWGVSGCRSPDRLRTWGSYLLACLLLPCAILHCFSSAFSSILDIWLFWVKLKISAWSPPLILLKPLTQGLCLYTLFLPLLQFYLSSRLPSVPTFPPSPPSRPSLPPVRPRRPPPCDSRWSLSLAGLLLLLLRS